jgi:hypothetical protein
MVSGWTPRDGDRAGDDTMGSAATIDESADDISPTDVNRSADRRWSARRITGSSGSSPG